MANSLKIQFVGSGDAFGSGGRLQTCIHLATGELSLLMDCGCSSLIGMKRCGIDPAEIDTVIISHLHGDHFGGLPFLLLEAKHVSRRTRPLTIIGPEGLERLVLEAQEALYPGAMSEGLECEVMYQVLNPQQPFEHPGFTLRCCPVIHGNSDQVFALRVETAAGQVVYTGDTEWTDRLIPFADQADLLISECFQYQQPTPSHLDYKTLQQQRHRLNCKRLVLTHLGEDMLQRLDDLEYEVAFDGMQISI